MQVMVHTSFTFYDIKSHQETGRASASKVIDMPTYPMGLTRLTVDVGGTAVDTVVQIIGWSETDNKYFIYTLAEAKDPELNSKLKTDKSWNVSL
jgi:hypothetical protein